MTELKDKYLDNVYHVLKYLTSLARKHETTDKNIKDLLDLKVDDLELEMMTYAISLSVQRYDMFNSTEEMLEFYQRCIKRLVKEERLQQEKEHELKLYAQAGDHPPPSSSSAVASSSSDDEQPMLSLFDS